MNRSIPRMRRGKRHKIVESCAAFDLSKELRIKEEHNSNQSDISTDSGYGSSSLLNSPPPRPYKQVVYESPRHGNASQLIVHYPASCSAFSSDSGYSSSLPSSRQPSRPHEQVVYEPHERDVGTAYEPVAHRLSRSWFRVLPEQALYESSRVHDQVAYELETNPPGPCSECQRDITNVADSDHSCSTCEQMRTQGICAYIKRNHENGTLASDATGATSREDSFPVRNIVGLDIAEAQVQPHKIPIRQGRTSVRDDKYEYDTFLLDSPGSSVSDDRCEDRDSFTENEDTSSSDASHSATSTQSSSISGSPDIMNRAGDFELSIQDVRSELVDQLMCEVRSLLSHHLEARNRAGSEGPQQPQTSTSLSGSRTSSGKGGKRAATDRQRPDAIGDNDDEWPNDTKRARISKTTDEGSSKKLACPFFQRDPRKCSSCRSCRGPGWASCHRVKEHVYRRHMLPITCPRCYCHFPTATELEVHQRRAESCPVGQRVLLDGISKEQERLLRSRQKHGGAEETKWRAMYNIIFPDDPVELMPSPYYADATDAPETSDRLEEYDRYMARELPRLVRHRLDSAISQGSEPLLSQLRGQLVDILRDCQAELYRSFQGPQSVNANVEQAAAGPFVDLNGPTPMHDESLGDVDWDLAAYFQPSPTLDSPVRILDFEFFSTATENQSGVGVPPPTDSGYGTNDPDMLSGIFEPRPSPKLRDR